MHWAEVVNVAGNLMATQLTQPELDRIKEEEIFREEVRKDLEKQRTGSGGKSLIAFFNTGLGLWILSTIALGLFSFTWTSAQEHVNTKEADSKKLAQLRVELAKDFREFSGAIGPAGDYTYNAKAFRVLPDSPRRKKRNSMLKS